MEYVYASMLLHKAGKEVSEANMGAVLKAAGVDVDSARIKATVAALKGVDIADVIKNAAVAAPASAPASAPAETKEEKKEEPKEDKGKSEEEAAAGLGALFG
tara:strand:- start:919 stop:1224 length:306 start_codon:yes stop_codon:yes gene_type:complete